VRIKKELEAQEAIVGLLDTELTNQIKLKEEVSALKQALEQLQQEFHHKEQELGNLENMLHTVETAFSQQLNQQMIHLQTALTQNLNTVELKVGTLSLHLNGLSRKQSVRT